MRIPGLYAHFFGQLVVAEYDCLATTCVNPYDAFPILLSNEPWNSRIPHPAYSSGNFTRPLSANRNISDPSNSDFSRNERIFVGDSYNVQWMQNVTKNATWDLYLVNEQYEKRFLNSPPQYASLGNTSLGGYLWPVKEDSFVRIGAMYFFYVARKDGYWSEGFASRFVNISRPGEQGAMFSEQVASTAAADVQVSGILKLGVALSVSFGIVFGC